MTPYNLAEIIKDNPNIDRTALGRSRQAVKQLADAGIALGGYRLIPALGSTIIKHSDGSATQSLVPHQE